MSEKTAPNRTEEPRSLTASEIRSRVEDIAEDLALKLGTVPPGPDKARLDAYPLDTRKFVMLMSGFIRMN